MTIIIGIDPGSRFTGYGIIRSEGNTSSHIAHGCLTLTGHNSGERLRKIFSGIQEIIQRFKPEEAAIEQVFMSQNPNSALKLGQARGAAIVALELNVAEYSARQVKQSVVGYGAAKKEQVQHMVQQLLNIKESIQPDAADALAIALCHAHMRFCIQKIGMFPARKRRARGFRDYKIEGINT